MPKSVSPVRRPRPGPGRAARLRHAAEDAAAGRERAATDRRGRVAYAERIGHLRLLLRRRPTVGGLPGSLGPAPRPRVQQAGEPVRLLPEGHRATAITANTRPASSGRFGLHERQGREEQPATERAPVTVVMPPTKAKRKSRTL